MRGILRAVMVGLFLGLACFATFFLINRSTLGRGDVNSVRVAFSRGDLQDFDYLYGNTGIGEHQFNDCLILGMASDQRAPRDELAISPTHGFTAMNSGICRELRQLVQGPPAANRPLIFYHNYVHGQTTIARLLLKPMGVAGLRALYKTLSMLLVAFGFGLSLWGLANGRENAAFWAVAFAVFGSAFGLAAFGQSLSHGPSDIVILLFALYLCGGAMTGGLSSIALVISAAVFGSLTAIFEMLTGGIPLGLALLTGGGLFALRDRRTKTVLESACAFVGSITAIFGAKIVLVVHTFGTDAVAEMAREANGRMYGQAPSVEPPRDLSVGSWLESILGGTHSLMPGLAPLAQITLLTACFAGLWGLLRLLRTEERERASILAASNLAIVGWMIVFWEHTIVHARFMDRILVWMIISGLALFVLAARHARPSVALAAEIPTQPPEPR